MLSATSPWPHRDLQVKLINLSCEIERCGRLPVSFSFASALTLHPSPFPLAIIITRGLVLFCTEPERCAIWAPSGLLQQIRVIVHAEWNGKSGRSAGWYPEKSECMALTSPPFSLSSLWMANDHSFIIKKLLVSKLIGSIWTRESNQCCVKAFSNIDSSD